jgi:transcriptional regulator with XRE-family HTH domain
MNEMTFGERIVYFRKRASMLQKELAEKAGISPTALNYYEKDKREPNVLTIIKIAKALGVTGDELIGTDTPHSPTQARTADEIQLLNDYRSLNKAGKEYIRQTMEMAASSEKYKKDNSVSYVEASNPG